MVSNYQSFQEDESPTASSPTLAGSWEQLELTPLTNPPEPPTTVSSSVADTASDDKDEMDTVKDLSTCGELRFKLIVIGLPDPNNLQLVEPFGLGQSMH